MANIRVTRLITTSVDCGLMVLDSPQYDRWSHTISSSILRGRRMAPCVDNSRSARVPVPRHCLHADDLHFSFRFNFTGQYQIVLTCSNYAWRPRLLRLGNVCVRQTRMWILRTARQRIIRTTTDGYRLYAGRCLACTLASDSIYVNASRI